MSKLLAALVYQEVFTRYYYLLAQLNHLEISWRGIKAYSTNVVYNLMRSLSTQANQLGFTKPYNYLLLSYNYLLEAALLHFPNNCRQLVVLCPGVT